jgi:hypothetical protein
MCCVVLCCLMRLHEWGYAGDSLCCHGMSWRVQDFSVVKLPCPRIREKENPVCQLIRRPCDIGPALRAALYKTSEAYLHSNIATDLNCLPWNAVCTLRFRIFPVFVPSQFPRCRSVAPPRSASVNGTLFSSRSYTIGRRDALAESALWEKMESRWDDLRSSLIQLFAVVSRSWFVRQSAVLHFLMMQWVRWGAPAAGCRLSDKAKWPMDTALPFLCCQRKRTLIVHKRQLWTR